MKLSISNIAWDGKDDLAVYGLMQQYGYTGLEIAPTRVFPDRPYGQLDAAVKWGRGLFLEYGISISSMQSIWYGRRENMFADGRQRKMLLDYTKKAVDFAAGIGCGNLVFGCPANRNVPDGKDPGPAVSFFKQLGDYAADKGCAIAIEANPVIYNTNFINDTASALDLIRDVDSEGIQLNLDVGTMLQNGEGVEGLIGNTDRIHHVHISEPGLGEIMAHELHKELYRILKAEGYSGYISIETRNMRSVDAIRRMLEYVAQIFGGGT